LAGISSCSASGELSATMPPAGSPVLAAREEERADRGRLVHRATVPEVADGPP
jgi:hypothetical protein